MDFYFLPRIFVPAYKQIEPLFETRYLFWISPSNTQHLIKCNLYNIMKEHGILSYSGLNTLQQHDGNMYIKTTKVIQLYCGGGGTRLTT